MNRGYNNEAIELLAAFLADNGVGFYLDNDSTAGMKEILNTLGNVGPLDDYREAKIYIGAYDGKFLFIDAPTNAYEAAVGFWQSDDEWIQEDDFHVDIYDSGSFVEMLNFIREWLPKLPAHNSDSFENR
jgi:hypothetical protein